MQRVLKPGGKALVSDLRRDAALDDINAYVDNLRLNPINAFMTKWTFKHTLLKNAYTKAEIREFVLETDFARCDIRENPMDMDIWLEK